MSNFPEQKCVAVAGATGYIGGRLVSRLVIAGYRVRCLVRSPAKLAGRSWAEWPSVEIRKADLSDPVSLTPQLEGCTAAYYLVHSMRSVDAEQIESDRHLATQFARAARDGHVGRIIYLGGLGETGPNLGKELSSRVGVETCLASTGIPVTVLRAAMIIGSGSASFEMLRYLVERLPVMITPRWVSTRCQPIAVTNVISYLVEALSVPQTAGESFDIGGPELLSCRDIMRIMADELGLRNRWMVAVPFRWPRLSAFWIQLVTPLSRRFAEPLVEGLKNPVVCRESRIRELIPLQLFTVREAISRAISQHTEHRVETIWSTAGAIQSDPDWAGGAVFSDIRKAPIDAPDWTVFTALCRIGGGQGWYAARLLWVVRGWVDVLVGGPGLRRGRRDPDKVEFGEALDFWRVVGIEQNRRLALRAEMKLPGDALLEFRIEPIDERHCVLHQAARFQPRGLFGLLYWYSIAPLHHVVFRGMISGIRHAAQEIAVEALHPPPAFK